MLIHHKCSSFNFFFKGKDLLTTHLNSDDELSMDLIYTVMDLYRHAMTLTREVEVFISG